MENITINQKQLFNVIKRTMSFSKEYAIEKLDADGNFIVFINGDFTDFFILSKSLVDYISTKSSAYIKLQETHIKFTKSANARAKELFKREADRNLNVQLETYKVEIRNLKDNFDQVNDLCEERERIINECNQKIIDYEAIIKDLKKANEYYIRKENCATPVKECDDHDSSYPPTKVK